MTRTLASVHVAAEHDGGAEVRNGCGRDDRPLHSCELDAVDSAHDDGEEGRTFQEEGKYLVKNN